MIISPVVSMERFPDGRYYVFDWWDPGRAKLYDRDGQFLLAIGRKGRGPGEYETPALAFVRPTDGAIVVLDQELQRLTVLSADATNVLATHRLPPFQGINGVVPLPDGRFIVNATHFQDASIGLPLHLLSENGVLIRSFGADPPITGSWDSGAYSRVMGLSEDGSIWSGHFYRYLVERWDTLGNRLQALERNVHWFPLVAKPTHAMSPTQPPSPQLAAVWEESGMLHLLFNTVKADWVQYLHAKPVGETGRVRYVVEPHRYAIFDATVRVVDKRTGEELASATLGSGLLGITGQGYAYSPDITDEPRVRVWRVLFKSIEKEDP